VTGVRALRLALGLAAAGAAVLVVAPAAGTSTGAETVEVVGAGTLAWQEVVVRAAPRATAPRVAVLREFRRDFRPQYVLALDRVVKRGGKTTWYRISVPGRPNGRAGWVRAASLELHPVEKRLIVYRGARRFELWDGRRLVRAGPIAVGKPGAETPLGLFYVTWKFDPTDDPQWAILGAYAFETSAYSRLTDWPGGGIVGVHGTPWPELLGRAVSHGCIRMSNENIEFLRSRVPLGTPVKIVS
jgi:lipoprotein-anchoring transpeptidase ErfK/SrfK